ncbi:MAG TPA: B-box zinc finger protein, partial [Thermoanaerobaculia bacterium]|nr:B-box zinc finger protein [Thermoanaerobaculia bacterium]
MAQSAACAAHPQSVARFQCDGCRKLLCDACIEESHRLLLCKLCGERALPLHADAPATSTERRQAARPAAAGPYSLADMLLYPFRGSGLVMFIISLAIAGVTTFLVKYSIFGCAALVLWLLWLTLLIGIQFKIVESTAKWENELPEWPEYFSFGERVVEVLTYLAIVLLNFGPLVAFLFAFGVQGLMTREPSLVFWLGAAIALWLGTALSVMAWGGAALHWRRSAVRIDNHVRALLVTGGDGLKTVNLTFALCGLVVLARALMSKHLPLLGVLVSGALGIYWTFLAPHLVGL